MAPDDGPFVAAATSRSAPDGAPPAALEHESYAQFSAALHARAAGGRLPSDATVEVTHRCPLGCAHCYNNLAMDDEAARRSELTLDEHRAQLDQLAQAGALWLLFTGGEIFARRDFLDIYAHAKRLGFLITLFTNGTLISPRIADALAAQRPFAIEITLYGATAETYERVTGVPGSYARCLRGIRLLLERKLPLALKAVAITLNKHEIGAMKALAAELGVTFKFDAMMNPRIDCSQSPLAVRLQPWEVVKLDLEDPRRVAEWRRLGQRLAQVAPRDETVYRCGGGVGAFAIDPAGRLSLCLLSHRDTYDLRAGSFREGWESFLRDVRGRKPTRRTKCSACRIRDLCGMCPANGELENGDPEAPVDFLCHTAHLRAHAMDIDVPAHGDCEYCEGGSARDAVLASAAAIAAHRDSSWTTTGGAHPRVIPIAVAERPAGGGCSSCG